VAGEEESPATVTAGVEKTEPAKNVESDVIDYPEFADPPKPKAEYIHVGGPQHKLIEAKIGESGIDRKELQEYLYHINKLQLVSDRPSFTTLTVENANKLIDKWDATMKAYHIWKDKQK
jgi:hypothetical protein